jgi:GTP-binding protein Era
MNDNPPFRSGFVTILGRPNAGKSTLLNALVGEKVAIVSEKPQTTRDRVTGILTTDQFQIVFVDTPGMIDPKDRFNEVLVSRAVDALEAADIIYHLVDPLDRRRDNAEMTRLLARVKGPARFLVVNKMDRVAKRAQPLPADLDPKAYDEFCPISALRRTGLDELINKSIERLPEGPVYFDPSHLTDRDERFLAAEIVREKVFRLTGEEVPYSVYTQVETFEERPGKDFIRIVVYVERDTQKAIIIGKGGQTLKKIGQEARRDIEKLTGRPAYLELWVKVRKDWRKKDFDLANFGFKTPRRKKRL